MLARRTGCALAALGIAACLGAPERAAGAALYNMTVLDPGQFITITPTGINDNGVIIGTAGGGGLGRSEIGILDGGNWTFLSAGAGFDTTGYKIDNNFDFVGSVAPIINKFQDGPTSSFAFIHGLGATAFDAVPGVANRATGVNNSGLVVGMASATPYQATAPFANANISLVPGLPQGYAVKDLNNSGTIVGTHGAEGGAGKGFMLNNGVLSDVVYPGAYGTYVNGISNSGLIVGTWFDSNHDYRGFVDNNGVFSDISFNANTSVFLEGINDAGQIVGEYWGATGLVGFLLDPVRDNASNGNPAFVGDVPPVTGFVPPPFFPLLLGQNLVDFSQFVDVPEPSSVALGVVWLAGLAFGRRALRRAGQAGSQCSP